MEKGDILSLIVKATYFNTSQTPNKDDRPDQVLISLLQRILTPEHLLYQSFTDVQIESLRRAQSEA